MFWGVPGEINSSLPVEKSLRNASYTVNTTNQTSEMYVHMGRGRPKPKAI